MADVFVWNKDPRSIGFIEFSNNDEETYLPVIHFNFEVISYISGPGTSYRGYELKILTTDGPAFTVSVEVMNFSYVFHKTSTFEHYIFANGTGIRHCNMEVFPQSCQKGHMGG